MTGRQTPDRQYRAAPAGDLIVRPLDIMTLVYQRRSGITHIVAEPVPQILEAMAGGTWNIPQIIQRLSALFDFETGAQTDLIIAERLEELADLGLLERIDAA